MKITAFTFPAVATFVAMLTGCSMHPVDDYWNQDQYVNDNDGHGYPIDWKHEHNSSTLSTIEYQPRELLVQNELQQARKESRQPDLSSVPAGGRIKVHLHSHNPRTANPDNFNFVVADKDDHVIKQESGPDSPPPGNSDPKAKSSPKAAKWEGVHTIDLEKPLQDQVHVHVINKNDQRRDDYIISHPTFKPQPAHVIDKDHPPGPAPVVR